MSIKLKTTAISAALLLGLISSPLMAEKDAGLDKDYRTFYTGGKIEYGKIGDSYNADLVVYLAGNQFMVIEKLITDFQKKNPSIKKIFVETIPPGQIFKKQILKQGKINGQKISKTPDVFASVNINHLRKLKSKKIMNEYIIYAHNKLELMVVKGNPKNIKGVRDLARDDLVQSHPNPLTEGIFKFYGSEMLKDLGLYQKVTAGKKCKSCWAIPGKTWFTSRHHRETPYRLENGQADVGIVWATEVSYAIASGRGVDRVTIPPPFNKESKVGYAIGKLIAGRNQKNADTYLAYLGTDDAQNIYASYDFIKATTDELTIKPLIPFKKK
ncbi:MAG: ABC transporter substrate-binding protein [Gammaproteobacteria bacterium]|nr:ABC transporter substrate-binding protein [Gammaproteobacteria bacterium]